MSTMRMALITVLMAVGCTAAVDSGPPVLERSTPEREGIPAAAIEVFVDAVAASGFEVHSFMMLRHGKVVTDGWWKPYGPELTHLLFSASKSLTSLGVGMAVEEGRLSLEDRVVTFFPEHVTDSVSPAMREVTVRDLLTMTVGQARDPAFTAMQGEEPWAKAFLHESPVHEPGSRFMYNNLATFMLSAIVQAATGERLFDYLRPRLFEPLGIEDVTWDENPQGITLGMIGARLRTEDLAKIGQLLLQEGEWQGRQVVPAAYVEDAGSFHIATKPDSVPVDRANDAQMGYGYQFWLGRDGSFRMEGLGGQIVIVMPEHDAVVVLTSNVGPIPEEVALVWEHLVPAMGDAPLPADPAANERLRAKLAALEVPPAGNASDRAFFDEAVAGERFVLEDNRHGVRAVTFALEDDRCVVTLERDDGVRTLQAGLGAWRYGDLEGPSLSGAGPGRFGRPASGEAAENAAPSSAALTCGMKDEDTLVLTARFVEDNLGAETWTADFEPGGTTGTTVAITTGAGRSGAPPPVLRGTVAADAGGDR